jgi:hypothetical protein
MAAAHGKKKKKIWLVQVLKCDIAWRDWPLLQHRIIILQDEMKKLLFLEQLRISMQVYCKKLRFLFNVFSMNKKKPWSFLQQESFFYAPINMQHTIHHISPVCYYYCLLKTQVYKKRLCITVLTCCDTREALHSY